MTRHSETVEAITRDRRSSEKRPAGSACRASDRPRSASVSSSRPRTSSAAEARSRRGPRTSSSTCSTWPQTRRSVGHALDQAAIARGMPRAITVDNGTEFTSKALDEWAYRRGVKLDYTRPGKPTDNGLIESFNGRLRDEFLNTHEFVTMQDVRKRLKTWKDDYNAERPHGSLGHSTPSEFAKTRSGQPSKAARLQLRTDRKQGRRHFGRGCTFQAPEREQDSQTDTKQCDARWLRDC